MTVPSHTKKDFASDQMVRWCPGCGDYAILAQTQAAFAEMGLPKEQFAVVAGIGCSSRFPYYMETYGFHTIHGRAPTFATGLKCTRPDLSVWVITGDGDGLSIGGNHLVHLFRRNVDVNVMMFNNQIYGLTKGQYSPTSEVGKRTKSTPMGSIDQPFNPLLLALGAGATYVSRSVDVYAKHLKASILDLPEHKGTSFLEIYQNCLIFNDNAFDHVTDRNTREDNVLMLEHGEPLAWGKTVRKGLVVDGLSLRVVDVDASNESDVLLHDTSNKMLATLLASMSFADTGVVPVGVFYKEERPAYDEQFVAQAKASQTKLGKGDLHALLHAGATWKQGA